MKQIEIHNRIDEFLKQKPAAADSAALESLISDNDDARQYFFSVADARWIDWLWSEGFLDLIKTAPDDAHSYGYRTPEISYLVRIASEAPEKVTEIILDDQLATTEEKFRPELIDQILRICESLPSEQLASVIKKAYEQKWTRIMSPFNRWGFEYEKIFAALADAGDYNALLLLADSVLAIKSEEEAGNKDFRLGSTNPFYFNELSYTKVFNHLVSVPEELTERTLELVSNILKKIVVLGGKNEDGEVFPVRDSFYLFDVSFFSLELGDGESLSYRDDVRELVAVAKKLAQKLIGGNCENTDLVKGYYEKYIAPLPDSRAM